MLGAADWDITLQPARFVTPLSLPLSIPPSPHHHLRRQLFLCSWRLPLTNDTLSHTLKFIYGPLKHPWYSMLKQYKNLNP